MLDVLGASRRARLARAAARRTRLPGRARRRRRGPADRRQRRSRLRRGRSGGRGACSMRPSARWRRSGPGSRRSIRRSAGPRDMFARHLVPGRPRAWSRSCRPRRAAGSTRACCAMADAGRAATAAAEIQDAALERGELGVAHAALPRRATTCWSRRRVALPAFAAGIEYPDPVRQTRWIDWAGFSYPFNLTQQPAISVPCGLTAAGLPVGLQIVGAEVRARRWCCARRARSRPPSRSRCPPSRAAERPLAGVACGLTWLGAHAWLRQLRPATAAYRALLQ